MRVRTRVSSFRRKPESSSGLCGFQPRRYFKSGFSRSRHPASRDTCTSLYIAHPQAGHFFFGKSAQNHSPEARVAEDSDCPARFARSSARLALRVQDLRSAISSASRCSDSQGFRAWVKPNGGPFDFERVPSLLASSRRAHSTFRLRIPASPESPGRTSCVPARSNASSPCAGRAVGAIPRPDLPAAGRSLRALRTAQLACLTRIGTQLTINLS